VVIGQGEVWWANLGDPIGSGPGFRRPVLIVQSDALNRSALATVVCVPLTSQLKWAGAAGNILLSRRDTGLGKPSVANASQIIALDRRMLHRCVGKIPKQRLSAVLSGVDVVLGRGPG
jgi:mRNA interferase MazF